jgi:hypothetical protein
MEEDVSCNRHDKVMGAAWMARQDALDRLSRIKRESDVTNNIVKREVENTEQQLANLNAQLGITDEVSYPYPNEWSVRTVAEAAKAMKESEYDSVLFPQHYNFGNVECIEAIEAALTPDEYRGYLKGTAIKYLWRERMKGGTESLEKAKWFIERNIAYDRTEKGDAPKGSQDNRVSRTGVAVRKAATTVDGAWGPQQAGTQGQGSLGEELCPF